MNKSQPGVLALTTLLLSFSIFTLFGLLRVIGLTSAGTNRAVLDKKIVQARELLKRVRADRVSQEELKVLVKYNDALIPGDSLSGRGGDPLLQRCLRDYSARSGLQFRLVADRQIERALARDYTYTPFQSPAALRVNFDKDDTEDWVVLAQADGRIDAVACMNFGESSEAMLIKSYYRDEIEHAHGLTLRLSIDMPRRTDLIVVSASGDSAFNNWIKDDVHQEAALPKIRLEAKGQSDLVAQWVNGSFDITDPAIDSHSDN